MFAEPQPKLLIAADLRDFEHPPADERLQYGEGPLQFGDLRIPQGSGPFPVALVIHGGCWRAKFGIAYTDELSAALTRNGFATWSLEYRRVGDNGGGWPGTFNDIANGADHLKLIAEQYQLDLDRLIAVGHSAGGHFALWLAARTNLPSQAPGSATSPLAVKGVLGLAPAPDITVLHEKKVCGHIIDKLMGGSPKEFPDRYRWGDPMQLAPADVRQILLIGKHDEAWRPSGLRYFHAAEARGDNVHKVEVAESGHFELVDPDSTSWPEVLKAARSLIGISGQ